MSIAYNYKQIDDGLVFCLDGKNPNSVSGNINLGGTGTLTKSNVTTTSNYGGGWVFAGTGSSYIDISRNDLVTSNNYTCEAWWLNYGISPTNRNYGVLFGNYGPGFTGSSQVWFFVAGLWHGSGYGYANSGTSAEAAAELTGSGYNGTKYGTVCHTISTKQGSYYKTWINGVLVSNFPNGADNTPAVNVNWRVGCDVNSTNAEALYGEIYFARAYNRALSDDEVLYNFNSTRERYGV
jgi:hypothetical protein